jgi:hypothetical protein
VGIAEPTLKELVLGLMRESWEEAEVELGDGRGRVKTVEVGVERTQEDIGIESGFGLTELAGMRGAVFEGKHEMKGFCGPLLAREPLAEDLEETSSHEEEWIDAFHGRFEMM